MCNVYEPATADYLNAEWNSYMRAAGGGGTLANTPYKQRLGPRDIGPFITRDSIAVGQWGMIRPGSPDRLSKDARGRPLMTNNVRSETMATKPTFRDAWKSGQRCLIPALSWDEPYWGTNDFNTWWRFRRKDGAPWMLAGLWSRWTDKATGEVVPSYTMITINANAHPLLGLMHKPERDEKKNMLPHHLQDKRAVVPIEQVDWDMWLTGLTDDALSLLQLPSINLFQHAPVDPAKAHVQLAPIAA